jgi:hypothetical protein
MMRKKRALFYAMVTLLFFCRYWVHRRYSSRQTLANGEMPGLRYVCRKVSRTEYYDLVLIDAYKALFVIGSDVYGPMGRELIPFSNEAGAAEFMKDHKAKKIINFKDVTIELVRSLD